MITSLAASRTTRLLVGAGILGIVLWRVGTGPFIDGLRSVDAMSLVAALVIGLVTTVCCAWRWRVVSRGLGVDVPMGRATVAYYRSQFLNSTLPGGVVGDVDRAVAHGRSSGDVGRGVRSVAWERSAGQLVQMAITVAVLLVLPSPVHAFMPAALLIVGIIAIVVVAVSRVEPGAATTRPARVLITAASDLRMGLLARSAWPAVLTASAVIVVGHAATFVIAATTAGVDASAAQLVPLALIVLPLPPSRSAWAAGARARG
jgi:uncharacterized membrane protein YbhN (UPF0104 family)